MSAMNALANFGRDSGNGLTIGLQMRQRRKESEQRNAFAQKRADANDQQNTLTNQRYDQQTNLAAADAEREYTSSGVKAMYDAPPEQRGQVYQGWLQGAQQQGYDVTGAPQEYSDAVMYSLAGKVGANLKNSSDMSSGIKEFNAMSDIIKNPGQYPESTVKMARIKMGLDPRAVGSSNITISETPGLTHQVAGSNAVIKGAESKAGSDATNQSNLAWQPQITTANETAKAEVSKTFDDKQKSKNAQAQMRKAERSYIAMAGPDVDLGLIYGRGESLMPEVLRSQAGTDLMTQRDQFVATLRLAEVGQLKGTGPITENEQKMLGQAATVLINPNISPTLAKEAIEQAWEILNRAASNSGTNGWSMQKVN